MGILDNAYGALSQKPIPIPPPKQQGLFGTLGDVGIGAMSGLAQSLSTPLGLLSHPGVVPRLLLLPFFPQTANDASNVTDGLAQIASPMIANAADATQRASGIDPQTPAGVMAKSIASGVPLGEASAGMSAAQHILTLGQKIFGQRPAPYPPWLNFGN